MAYEPMFDFLKAKPVENEPQAMNDMRTQSNERGLLAGATPALIGLLMGDVGTGAQVGGKMLLDEDKRFQDQQNDYMKAMAKRETASQEKKGKRYQSIPVENKNGTVTYHTFDTYEGNYAKPDQNLIKGYAPRIGVNPETGELARTSKGSGRTTGIRQEGSAQRPFNVKEEKDVKQMKDRMMADPEFKRAKSGVNASNRAIELLKSNNPVSDEGIKTVFPRMFGEVGNLAVQEQERFSGSPELSRRYFRLKEKWTEGKLTDQDRSDLIAVAQVMFEFDKQLLQSVTKAHSDSLSKQTGISEESIAPVVEPFARAELRKGSIAKRAKKDFATRLTGEDKEAYNWAKKNKNDPRAKELLIILEQKNGE